MRFSQVKIALIHDYWFVGSKTFNPSISNIMFAFIIIVSLSLKNTTALAVKAIPIQIADWYLEPTLDVTFGRTESEFTAEKIESKDSFWEINPKVVLSNKTQQRELRFSYELDAVGFSDNSEGDYESSYLNGEYRRAISNSSDISLRGEYTNNSQTNGVRSELQTISPINENQRIDLEARELLLQYEFYGPQRQRAGHLFDVSIALGERNFDASEVDVSDRNVDYQTFDAKWRYLWSEGNGVFVNFQNTDFDYEAQALEVNAELDNRQTEIIVGFEWQAKQNISGEIGLGIVRKKFDELDIEVEVPSFYGELEIVPTALDNIRIQAQRKPLEQSGSGAFQDYRELELNWVRRLSPRWSFEAYLGSGDVDYEQSTRKDEFYRYGLIFEYRLSRSADLIFGYRYYDDDSNEDRFDYNGNNVFITFSTSL